MTRGSPAQQDFFSQRPSRKSERRYAASVFALVCVAACVGALGLFMLGAPPWAWLLLGALIAVALVAIDPIMRRPGGIPCLTWHSVSANADWLPWAANTAVKPATLDRQLSILTRMGLSVMDTSTFHERRLAGQHVPESTVMLHFDDGYRDNLIAAHPVLARHGMQATLFISLDFIAPDGKIAPPINLNRHGDLGADYDGSWAGYLSWRELSWLEHDDPAGVFDVQPHGVGHGRVAISDRTVDVLDAANWRKLAWMQWAHMPGDKNDWYLNETPPAVPLGTPVPESNSALAAREWTPGKGLETVEAFEERVMSDFIACMRAFKTELNKTPAIFCWPQNLATPQVRVLANKAGFVTTTAGKANNRADENPQIISRLHVGERYAGFESVWLDDLAFRASVRTFQGNHYWYLVLLPIHGLSKLFTQLPRRVAPSDTSLEVAL